MTDTVHHATPRHPSTCSSSAPARPASRSAGTCSSRTPGSCSSTPAAGSARCGGTGGTRCGCSPPPSTTACPTCRSPRRPAATRARTTSPTTWRPTPRTFDLPVRLGTRGSPGCTGRPTGYTAETTTGRSAPGRSSSPPGRSPRRRSPALAGGLRAGRRPGAQLRLPPPGRPAGGTHPGRGRRQLRACRSPTSSPPPGDR